MGGGGGADKVKAAEAVLAGLGIVKLKLLNDVQTKKTAKQFLKIRKKISENARHTSAHG